MKIQTLALLALIAIAIPAFGGEELAIGADAPAFSLLNAADGKYVSFDPKKNKLSVVVFTCNECPYAKAFEPRIIELAKHYAPMGVTFYAVNPNDDAAYPAEAMDKMRARATSKGFPFPYLKDTDSAVASKYGARVTPHVFIVDSAGRVRYRGYVDDSAKVEERKHLGMSDALDAILAGGTVKRQSTKAFGCSIKWKRAS
ncbi:MAG: thioredoxin family protein [Acidobacteria bacterium]|nr:thioredoxin family protein [Acidobacteriota bacterium]